MYPLVKNSGNDYYKFCTVNFEKARFFVRDNMLLNQLISSAYPGESMTTFVFGREMFNFETDDAAVSMQGVLKHLKKNTDNAHSENRYE